MGNILFLVKLLFISTFALIFTSGCSKNPAEDSSNKQTAEPAHQVFVFGQSDPKEFIDAYVYKPYNVNAYVKFAAMMGDRFAEIQPIREKAALLAIKNPSCDKVAESEVLTTMSTKELIRLRVICSNQVMFEFDETEIAKLDVTKHSFRSLQESAWDETEAIIQCEKMVKAAAKFPDSVDIQTFSTHVATAKYSAVVSVNFKLTMLNGFGNEIPHKARCLFQPNSAEGLLDSLEPG